MFVQAGKFGDGERAIKLVLSEELVQLGGALLKAAPVGGVDHVHKKVRGLEVVASVRLNSLL